jgi:hypothetical protein
MRLHFRGVVHTPGKVDTATFQGCTLIREGRCSSEVLMNGLDVGTHLFFFSPQTR